MRPGEYWGAVELPYTDLKHHDASGKLYVTFERPDDTDPADPQPTTMHVFAQQIRIDAETQEVQLYLDFHRFAGAPAGMDDEDRIVSLSAYAGRLSTGVRVRAVNWFGATPNWFVVPSSGIYAQAGACTTSPPASTTGAEIVRCDAEFEIPIPPSRLTPVPTGPEAGAGIGFAFATYSVTPSDNSLNHPSAAQPYFAGAMPETFADHIDDSFDRRDQMTLLLHKPDGVPLRFLSWNLAHWGSAFEWVVGGNTFHDVDLGDLADVMKDYDVVAVQEMWSATDAHKLLREINARRAADAQMTITGPVDFESDVLANLGHRIIRDHVDYVTSALTDTQGGIWIYSAFPVVDSHAMTYSRCRGADCFKAKGVLHVRVALRPPGSGSESRLECVKEGGGEAGRGCPPDPTGEMYVDIFDTHMNAGNDTSCKAIGVVASWVFDPVGNVFANILHPGTGTELNCAVDVEEIKRSQFREMASFVANFAPDPNRTILAGDFNVNGRRIGVDAAPTTYDALLRELGVFEQSLTWPDGPALIDGAQDDTINLHPGVFSWEVDHGDIAREETEYEWLTCGIGTHAGKGEDRDCRAGPAPAGTAPRYDRDAEECLLEEGCPRWSCDLLNDDRLDYILVGAYPAAVNRIGEHARGSVQPRPQHPAYLIGRGPGEEPLWQRIFPVTPASSLSCGGGGGMLSDHSAVAANLELFPMRQPAAFHPNWDHGLQLTVTSANATGVKDCIFGVCGQTELYVKMSGTRTSYRDLGGLTDPVLPYETTHCHGWSVPRVADPECTADWGVWEEVRAGVALKDNFIFRLYDDDSTSGDDNLPLFDDANDVNLRFDWSIAHPAVWIFEGVDHPHPVPDFPHSVTIRNTDPIPYANRAEPVMMGLRIQVQEDEISEIATTVEP